MAVETIVLYFEQISSYHNLLLDYFCTQRSRVRVVL